MMDEHVSDWLLAYVEDRLPLDVRVEVDAHVSTCTTCWREVSDARRAIAMLAEARQLLSRMQSVPAMRRGWNHVRQKSIGPDDFNTRRGLLPRWVVWQVSVSMAVVVMALASNFTLQPVRTVTPSIPAIQTPLAHVVALNDTATMRATLPQDAAHTPTVTPKPLGTN